MPFYEYTCQGCSKEFTLQRKYSEMNDPAPCPECGNAETKRKMGNFFATNTGGTTAAATLSTTKVRHT